MILLPALGLFLATTNAFVAPERYLDFQRIIDEVNSGPAKWKAGHNFQPKTPLSRITRLLGSLKSNKRLPYRGKHFITNSAVPEEFDARTEWPQCPTISHISDQSNCGSCWAVAAASAFGDRYCIATKGKFTLPLSAEELLSCCSECGAGCNGGYPELAWEYFSNHGIVTGGDYNSTVGCQPYEMPQCEHHVPGKLEPCTTLPDYDTPDCKKTCTNPSYKQSFRSDNHKTKTSYSLERDESAIRKEILRNGPVEASFNVYADFVTYKSGVYHHVTGDFLGGHAVRVIGWGNENSTPYWLVANSWNEAWGDNGLFKIKRGNNECDFESGMTAGIPDV